MLNSFYISQISINVSKNLKKVVNRKNIYSHIAFEVFIVGQTHAFWVFGKAAFHVGKGIVRQNPFTSWFSKRK